MPDLLTFPDLENKIHVEKIDEEKEIENFVVINPTVDYTPPE
ncbi:15182_t:CDS:1, partial [Entrophospora sp. SA101]